MHLAGEGRLSTVIATPIGHISVTEDRGRITSIDFVADSTQPKPPETPTLKTAAAELLHYFVDPRHAISLPLAFAGTPYMRRVWIALTEIPPGSTETYGSLARQLGSGPRAVAAACRANTFAIAVPCHRVVSATGLGGYCGQTEGPLLEIKRWLLRHEGCARD